MTASLLQEPRPQAVYASGEVDAGDLSVRLGTISMDLWHAIDGMIRLSSDVAVRETWKLENGAGGGPRWVASSDVDPAQPEISAEGQRTLLHWLWAWAIRLDDGVPSLRAPPLRLQLALNRAREAARSALPDTFTSGPGGYLAAAPFQPEHPLVRIQREPQPADGRNGGPPKPSSQRETAFSPTPPDMPEPAPSEAATRPPRIQLASTNAVPDEATQELRYSRGRHQQHLGSFAPDDGLRTSQLQNVSRVATCYSALRYLRSLSDHELKQVGSIYMPAALMYTDDMYNQDFDEELLGFLSNNLTLHTVTLAVPGDLSVEKDQSQYECFSFTPHAWAILELKAGRLREVRLEHPKRYSWASGGLNACLNRNARIIEHMLLPEHKNALFAARDWDELCSAPLPGWTKRVHDIWRQAGYEITAENPSSEDASTVLTIRRTASASSQVSDSRWPESESLFAPGSEAYKRMVSSLPSTDRIRPLCFSFECVETQSKLPEWMVIVSATAVVPGTRLRSGGRSPEQILGRCFGTLVDRDSLRSNFAFVMRRASEELSRLSLELFDRHGRLDDGLKRHPSRKGTGVWGNELDNGPIFLIESFSVDRRYRRLGIGRHLSAFLLSNVESRVPDFVAIVLPAVLREDDYLYETSNLTEEQMEDFEEEQDRIATRFWRSIGFRRIGSSPCFGLSSTPTHPARHLQAASDFDP